MKKQIVHGFTVKIDLAFETQRERNLEMRKLRKLLKDGGHYFEMKRWFGKRIIKLELVKK